MEAGRLEQIRKWTDELLNWARGKGRILIVMHDNPDPDSLASAMALRHLFVVKLNCDPVISFSGIIARSENLVMATELEMFLTPIELLNLSDFPVICMLDTQPGSGNTSFPPNTRVDVVIDHHPLRQETKNVRWADVCEEYGITATRIYDYLIAQGVSISTKLATALFYAIKSETQDLGREASPLDREAYHRLFPLTNKRLLNAITHPRLPKEYFSALHRALENARIYGNLMIAVMGEVDFPEIVAEMADLLLRLQGAETALTIAYYGTDIILSIRTTSPDLNAGEVIRNIVGDMGKAGGHGMMAGGKIGPLPPDEKSRKTTENVLIQRLLDALHIGPSTPQELLIPFS